MQEKPNLLNLIRDWLESLGADYPKWEIQSYDHISQSDYNLPVAALGVLTGMGWPITIWENRIESFFHSEEWVNGNVLMASDPLFFEKLRAALDAIVKHRRDKAFVTELFPNIEKS